MSMLLRGDGWRRARGTRGGLGGLRAACGLRAHHAASTSPGQTRDTLCDAARDVPGARPSTILLSELTWEEVRDALAAGRTTVIFACGSTEQHGPHLPLAVDSLIGAELAERVAAELGDTLVGPPLTIGCSGPHMAFAGSLTLSEATFRAVLADYCFSLARHGFAEICILPSHGDNFRPILDALPQIRALLPPGTVAVAACDLLGYIGSWSEIIAAAGGPAGNVGGHADIAESSMILAIAPSLVRAGRAEPGYLGELAAALPSLREHGFAAVTGNGVLGDPAGMSAELGELLLDGISSRLAAVFRDEILAQRTS